MRRSCSTRCRRSTRSLRARPLDRRQRHSVGVYRRDVLVVGAEAEGGVEVSGSRRLSGAYWKLDIGSRAELPKALTGEADGES